MNSAAPRSVGCPVTGKTQYPDERSALLALKHAQRDWDETGAGRPHVYLCPCCERWHLTRGKGRPASRLKRRRWRAARTRAYLRRMK